MATKTRRHEASRSQHDSFQSFAQNWNVEVYEKPDTQSRRAKISKHLGVVDRMKFVYALKFDNNRVFNYQIKPVRAEQFVAVVKLDHPLLVKPNPMKPEFDGERSAVNVLEQAWSQRPVYGDAAADHLFNVFFCFSRERSRHT